MTRRSWLTSFHQRLMFPMIRNKARRKRRMTPVGPAMLEMLETRQLLSAGTVPVGVETQVSTYTNDVNIHNVHPVVAVDGAGNTVTVWEEQSSANPNFEGIYAKKYSATGAVLVPQIQVNTYTAGLQREPSVAMDAAGDFTIAWDSQRTGSTNYDVYARCYNAAGIEQQTTEFRVNTTTNGPQLEPSVAMDAKGDTVIAWKTFYTYDPLHGEAIEAQRYTVKGSPQLTEFRVNAYTAGILLYYPRVAMDGSGDFVIAWEESRDGGASYDIYAQQFNAVGSLVGNEFLVNAYTTGQQITPAIAMNSTGDFVITWTDVDPDSTSRDQTGVYAQRCKLSATGSSTIGGEFQVNTYTSGLQNSSSVAIDSAGDFVITWQSSYQDGSTYGVFGQAFNVLGSILGSEFRGNATATGPQNLPSVAMDAAGDFSVVWESYPVLASPNTHGTYLQRYSLVKPNPAPTITAPATVAVNGSSSLLFTGNSAISVADGSGTAEKLTLTVLHGTLTFGSTTGLTATGNGTATVTLTGPLSALNSALLTFKYQAIAGYHGSETLILSDSDTISTLKGTANVAITVNAAPVVTVDPTSQRVVATHVVSFTAAATGSPVPTVHWQVSTDGGKTFANITNVASATTPALAFTVTASQNGYEYKAVFTNSLGTATTKVATLTVPRTIVVDVLGDQHVAGHTTLRDAIVLANGDTGGDAINFAAGMSGTIALTQGELTLTKSMTITGPGSGVLTISGNKLSRILEIDPAGITLNQVAINGLTLTQGNGVGTIATGLGGAILSINGQLTLLNDVLSNNSATGAGAIYSSSVLISRSDTFSGNSAATDGGGVDNSGTFTSTNDLFSKNSGGAIDNSGVLTSTNDTFQSNSGGGITNSNKLTISNDSFSSNSTSGDGGGVYTNGGTVISSNNTFSGNSATSFGGGIGIAFGVVSSTNDTFFSNSADAGGGIGNLLGHLTSTNDTIAANVVNHYAGLIGVGGGVWSDGVWNSLNTIVAGNHSGTVPSDISIVGGTFASRNDLIGDAATSGGITNGDANGNIVGKATNTTLAVDSTGKPILASNGGPTQTIALATGSPAINKGGSLATLTVSITATATTFNLSSATFVVVGDEIRVDSEIVVVTAVSGQTVTVSRGQGRTVATSHLANATVTLAFDQRGVRRTTNDIGAF